MAIYPEKLSISTRMGVGSMLALGTMVAGTAIAEQPIQKHEVVMEMEYGDTMSFHAASVGGAALAETSTIEAVAAIATRPDHCTDYQNMEAGHGDPVNQDWFNHLEVRTGKKDYARLVLACLYAGGTDEWNALNELWQLENSGSDRPNWNIDNIPQAKPFSKTGCAEIDHRCQARWGLKYIEDRYGSPSAALRAWWSRSPHWY